jgi:hypothetical protein
MRSTIADELARQHRDGLTNEAVEALEKCPSGNKHRWRLMEWSQQQETIPHYSIYSATPIIEMGSVTTSSKMFCCCGASVNFEQKGR